jgi:hypothetical protein
VPTELLFAAAVPAAKSLWILSGALLAALLMVAFALIVMAKRYAQRGAHSPDDSGSEKPRSDNPAAFMTASMQAVIKKLKEQEKELEILHRAERERAQQT